MMRGRLYSAVILAAVFGLLAAAVPARARPAVGEEEERTVGELKEAAKGGGTRERVRALEALGRMRDLKVIHEWDLVEFLLDLSLDGNPRIAWKAVCALGNMAMGAGRTVAARLRSPFIRLLGSPDRHVLVRMQAATELGRTTTGDAGEVAAALARAGDPGPTVPVELAAEALRELGSIGDPRGAEAILKGLVRREPLLRRAALEALGRALSGPNARKFLTPRTGTQLLDFLSGKGLSHEARECAIGALGRAMRAGHRIPGAGPALLKILREEKRPGTLTAALRTIGWVGSPQAARPMLEVYERLGPKEKAEAEGDDGRSEVRAQVCAAAGELFDLWGRKRHIDGSAGAARILTDLLVAAIINDTSDIVREEAAISLGNLYSPRYDKAKAVAALIAVVGAKGVSEAVRKAALDSLKILSCRSFEVPGHWERWYEENKRRLCGVSR